MSIIKFKIQNNKAVVLAECENIPKIMIIAGPNGVGKSTLLYAIHQRVGVEVSGNTKFLYQPPNRVIRKTTVKRGWLGGGMRHLIDLIAANDVSGYEGLSFQNPSRSPDNVDEAGSTIKHTLGKIENRRQTLISEYVDKSKKKEIKELDINKIPEIYKPLSELTEYLLPHLKFDRIDFTNEDNIRCIWKRTDKGGEKEVDIDDLSSGEKSIIILFLPLLENEITKRLNNIEKIDNVQDEHGLSPEQADNVPDQVFIMDEPELHLHPDLQARILTYIRGIASAGNTQFIIATHSPTILDQALDEELFLFSPASDNPSENQLTKIATNIEKLEALKQLAGNTYLITTGRSIICIEGGDKNKHRPMDIRLLEILYPRSTAYTFIPAGGKGTVIQMVKQLKEYLLYNSFGVRIFGLVDSDQRELPDGDSIYNLPVCMVENLLLDYQSIYNYLKIISVDTFNTPDEILAELNNIASSLEEEEIEFRIIKKIKIRTVRLSGKSKEDLLSSLEREIEQVKQILPEEQKLSAIIKEAGDEVAQIKAKGEELLRYRGKKILNTFYQNHVQVKNISYASFCYKLAEEIAKGNYAKNLLNPVFDQIEEEGAPNDTVEKQG